MQPAQSTSVGTSLIKGMWVWQKRWILQPEAQDQLLAFCQRHDINRLLIQVHYGWVNGKPVIEEPESYRELVSKAFNLGIRIEALDGDKSMALAVNQPRTLLVLQAILDLHASMPAGRGFAGIHYDIEPYLLDAWSDPDQREGILLDLLTYYESAAARIHEADPDLILACDIPFWFDTPVDEAGLPLAIEFHGLTKPVQQHIQDLCDYVGIMSYRREATGPNSITAISTQEIQYARQIGKKACMAVETVAYPPVPTISFHGMPAILFKEQFQSAWQSMQDEPGFGGMLIHCFPDAMEVMEGAP